MADTFDLQGFDNAMTKLRSLPEEVRKRTGRSALRKGAQLIRDAAKQNASRLDDPETAERIAANIEERFSTKTFKRTGDLAFRVGVLGGARIPKSRPKGTEPGGPGGDTRYWAFVEFGHEHARAQPFMRPAIEQNIDGIVSTVATNLDKGLDRALKRQGKT